MVVGQSLKDYANQGVNLSRRVGATGKRVKVSGRDGGIISAHGKVYTTW